MATSADRIIARTVDNEGGNYSAVNLNDVGTGISFGVVQFNQASGDLAGSPSSPLFELFRLMYSKDSGTFNSIFGDYAGGMLNKSWVKNNDLSGSDFVSKLKAAGRVPAFQAAQRELLERDYLKPAMVLAKRFNIQSERGVAMVFDTVIQRGYGTAMSVLQSTPSTGNEKAFLTAFAPRADEITRGSTTRRQDMLNDPWLSDATYVAGASITTVFLVGLIAYALWDRLG
jgi:hypothetical protein